MSSSIFPVIHVGDALDVFPAIEDNSIDLIAIDPPYNVKKAGWDKKGSGAEYQAWLAPYLSECKRTLTDRGTIAVFGVQPMIMYVQLGLVGLGFSFQNYVARCLSQGGNNGHVLMRRHEDILIYSKTPRPYFDVSAVTVRRAEKNIRRYGGKVYDTKRIGDWWQFDPVDSASGERTAHPTQKPVRLMERLISILCPVDGIVLDCFGGSGTTSVAAMNLKRRSIYIDIDPGYASIARDRFCAVLDCEKSLS
jgi:DNA modification methylase